MKKLKNDKAAGKDDVTGEMENSAGKLVIDWTSSCVTWLL